MSTDISKFAPQQMVPAGDQDFTGLSDVVRIKPSNITLIQPMTQNPRNARLGQYLDELTGEVHDTLTVVPLRVSRNRVLFPQGNSFGGDPICRSTDGVYPSPFAQSPQAQSCAVCPQSEWVNNKKPPCKDTLNLLVIVKETGLPRYLNFSGMSVKVLRDALEGIQQSIKVREKTSGVKGNLYDYYFTLSIDVVRKQTVYAMHRIENITAVKETSEFGPLFKEYVLDRLHDPEEREAEAVVNNAVDKAIDAVMVDGPAPFDVGQV